MSITSEETWQQEHEVVGHTASAVKGKGEMNAGTQLTVSFFNLGLHPKVWCCSHSGWVIPSQLTLSRNSLTAKPRGMSPGGI